jgi:hypothetical protein
MPTDPTAATAADATKVTVTPLASGATAASTTPITKLPISTVPVTTLPTIPVTTVPGAGSAVALSPGNPKITTTAPTSSVSVTVPNTSGQVTFSLVVTDNLGVVSSPATVTVTIQSPPTAVLRTESPTVAAGGPIQLSGTGSTSSGSIASYTFSLVNPT